MQDTTGEFQKYIGQTRLTVEADERKSAYDDLTDPIFDSEYQETYPIVRKVGAVLLAMVLIAAFVAAFIAMAPGPR